MLTRTLGSLFGYRRTVARDKGNRRPVCRKVTSFDTLEERSLLSDGLTPSGSDAEDQWPNPYPAADPFPSAAQVANQVYQQCMNETAGVDPVLCQNAAMNAYTNAVNSLLGPAPPPAPPVTQPTPPPATSGGLLDGLINTVSDWWDSAATATTEAYYDAYWTVADWLGDEESTFGQLAANDIYGNDVWGDPGLGAGVTGNIPFVLGGGGTINVGFGCEAIYIPQAGAIVVYCYYQGGAGVGTPGVTAYVGPQMTYDLEDPAEYTGSFVNGSGGAAAPTGLPGLSVDGTPDWWNQVLNGGGTNGDPYTVSGSANFGSGGSATVMYQQYFIVCIIPVGEPHPCSNPFWFL